jgi:hypothetical protein
MRVMLTFLGLAALATVTFAVNELSALREVAHPVPVVRAADPPPPSAPSAVPREARAAAPRELSTWRGPTPFGGVPGAPEEHPVVLDEEDVDSEEEEELELAQAETVELYLDGERRIDSTRVIRFEEIIY